MRHTAAAMAAALALLAAPLAASAQGSTIDADPVTTPQGPDQVLVKFQNPVDNTKTLAMTGGWSLAFSDEFNGVNPDGTGVDETKWNYRTDVKPPPGNSSQKKENVSVANGVMSIALKKESDRGKPYTGGGLVSKQTFRYGYYEVRMKINDGAGWHSSFWLQQGDGTTTFPPEQRTEIDTFEIDSISPKSIRHNIITWKGSAVGAGYSKTRAPYDTGKDLRGWHYYGLLWTENGVVFFVDGKQDASLGASLPYWPAKWTHDQVSIWLTAIAYRDAVNEAKLPGAVQFDYVRYWQRDYYVDNDGPAAAGYAEAGNWNASSLTGWTVASPTRYANCGGANNTVSWTPNILQAGKYDVYFYNVINSGSDPYMQLSVAGQLLMVNGTTGTKDTYTNNGAWVKLTAQPLDLPAGSSTPVTMTSSSSGCARADAVKFVRVVD